MLKFDLPFCIINSAESDNSSSVCICEYTCLVSLIGQFESRNDSELLYTCPCAVFLFASFSLFFFPFRIVFVLSWKSLGTRLERMVVR